MDSFELNKIIGAVLASCILLLVTSFTASAIFAAKPPEKPGFAIAAKEAAAKALGTGISRGVTWRELEVVRPPGQRPTLHLSGRAAAIAARLGVRHLALSLSHTRELALAVVVAED